MNTFNGKKLFILAILLIPGLTFSGCATVYKKVSSEGKSKLELQNLTMYKNVTVSENGVYRQLRERQNLEDVAHAENLSYVLLDATVDHSLILESNGKEAEVAPRTYCDLNWVWIEGPFFILDKIMGGCMEFKPIDVAKTLTSGRFVVFNAIEKNDKARLKKVLTVSPDLLQRRDTDGLTPLHSAIASGNLDMVQIILSFNPDLNAKVKGQTPLQFANNLKSDVPGKYDKIVELLSAK